MKIEYISGAGHFGLPCWVALPDNFSTEPTPLVAVHGIKRGVSEQVEYLAAHASAQGRPVIAPEFNEMNWRNYQQVVRRSRADLALIGLMQKMRTTGIWQTQHFDLAGYSGGAQFAHRFAMLYPHLIGKLTASAAGWYTFPDGAPFPYGLGDPANSRKKWGSRIRARFCEFLTIPIDVAVGALDTKIDKATRSFSDLDLQQGINRFQRGQNWVNALNKAAKIWGITKLPAHFHVLPDSGHNFVECIENGGLARIILPGSKSSIEKTSDSSPCSPGDSADITGPVTITGNILHGQKAEDTEYAR